MRFGADLTENYYEYEIPLHFTPWHTSYNEPDLIWPEENKFKIDLKRLVQFKIERNEQMRNAGATGISLTMPFYAFDGNNRVTILGSPNLSSVKP